MESRPSVPPSPRPPSRRHPSPKSCPTCIGRSSSASRSSSGSARAREAGRIRVEATRAYSNAWDDGARRDLLALLARADRSAARRPGPAPGPSAAGRPPPADRGSPDSPARADRDPAATRARVRRPTLRCRRGPRPHSRQPPHRIDDRCRPGRRPAGLRPRCSNGPRRSRTSGRTSTTWRTRGGRASTRSTTARGGEPAGPRADGRRRRPRPRGRTRSTTRIARSTGCRRSRRSLLVALGERP